MAADAQGANTAARSHLLYGMLDFIARKAQKNESDFLVLSGRVSKLEDAIKGIADMQRELKALIEKSQEDSARSTMSIEKTHYQVYMMHKIIGNSFLTFLIKLIVHLP